MLQGTWVQAKLIWGAGLSNSISFPTARTACRQVSNSFLNPSSLLESAVSVSDHLWLFWNVSLTGCAWRTFLIKAGWAFGEGGAAKHFQKHLLQEFLCKKERCRG